MIFFSKCVIFSKWVVTVHIPIGINCPYLSPLRLYFGHTKFVYMRLYVDLIVTE